MELVRAMSLQVSWNQEAIFALKFRKQLRLYLLGRKDLTEHSRKKSTALFWIHTAIVYDSSVRFLRRRDLTRCFSPHYFVKSALYLFL